TVLNPQPYQHVAAKSLGYPETFAGCDRHIDLGRNGTSGKLRQDLIDQGEALLDLTDAHPHARIHIAGLECRDFKIEPAIRWIAKYLARVESAAAPPSDIAPSPELSRQRCGQCSSPGSTVLQRCGVVIKFDQFGEDPPNVVQQRRDLVCTAGVGVTRDS